MSHTFEPIAPWPVVLAFAAVVTWLTLWAYRRRLSGSSGNARWIALGLRLAAVLMCVLAAFRPALQLTQKIKQSAGIVLLVDDSESMGITDEANGRSRYAAAKKSLDEALDALKGLQGKVEVKAMRFSDQLHDAPPKGDETPTGPATALGTALDETVKQMAGTRLMAVVVLSDFASNAGPAPLQAAQRLQAQQVPVWGVGFGSESAGAASRDLVARDVVAGPTVFIKNEAAIRGVVVARGFAGQTADVELYVEDDKAPVATKHVPIKDNTATIPITDLKWIPQRSGETKLTLKVKPKDGELVPTNNAVSTYVTVQSGGLGVLYLAGPGTVWEQKYITRALDAAQEIQVFLRVLRRPVSEDPSALPDDELQPGKYDVIVLGDLPANFLTPLQHRLLKRCLERGAGLMMLGGRSSFGSGGWASAEIAEMLPTRIHAGDAQLEPEGGLKVVPDPQALDSYVLRIAPTTAESVRMWAEMPPIPGANQLGPAKESAIILARAPTGDALLAAQETGPSRVLAFAGETWPWARYSDATQAAHRKFWRQVILWLAHKENQNSEEVRLTLDRRRISVGQKVELTVTARDAKGEPARDLTYETTVVPAAAAAVAQPEKVDLFQKESEAAGSYFATGKPGEYRVTVIARRNGQEIGRDQARFLVYQEDREMENPSADLALMRQITELTKGKAVAQEKLVKELKSLRLDDVTDTVVQREVRLWDNWPFFLIFTAILSLEWCIRKRNGWV